MNRPESAYPEPVVKVSQEPVYAIFDQAPAPAVPPAMSKRSRELPAAPLNEYMYRPSRMSDSSAHFESQVLPAQFALIPVVLGVESHLRGCSLYYNLSGDGVRDSAIEGKNHCGVFLKYLESHNE